MGQGGREQGRGEEEGYEPPIMQTEASRGSIGQWLQAVSRGYGAISVDLLCMRRISSAKSYPILDYKHMLLMAMFLAVHRFIFCFVLSAVPALTWAADEQGLTHASPA